VAEAGERLPLLLLLLQHTWAVTARATGLLGGCLASARGWVGSPPVRDLPPPPPPSSASPWMT